jgi:NAD(P)-dependent dehydrogenase (short-subunit alcohol dehydrogenase family)
MSKQKVWFITGASRGFGFDITKAALASGDKVVATVRKNSEKLEAAFGQDTNLLVVVLDVINEVQIQAAVEKTIQHFGQIDVLVNNAGYGLLAATEEASDAEVRKQFDTNVFGLLNVTRAILPHMRSQRSGHIINISSLFGYSASVPGFGIYGSTKYAVEGISEGLALEVKSFGIKVTAAAPGLFSTEFISTDSYAVSAIVLDAYAATVGAIRGAVGQLDGSQPGDPAKLADVIIKLANSENPPLHLPIGRDSVQSFRDNSVKISEEVTAWEEVSISTDHVKN